MPPILAMQSVLGVLQLLDLLHVTIYPMVHRATVRETFSLGFSFIPALIPLMLITLVYLFARKRSRGILISALISICLHLTLGHGVSIVVLSLMLVGWALSNSRKIQDYFTWLLGLLAVFEGLALVHWVLLPFFVSPLAWFADLELSLFYVASYLAPLLVLPLMFMWVLRPVLRWVFHDEA